MKEVNGVMIIEIAAGKTKMKRPLMLPLAGPILEPIAKDLKKLFRVSDQPVFESTNFRREWAKACAKAGIGAWDAKKLTRPASASTTAAHLRQSICWPRESMKDWC